LVWNVWSAIPHVTARSLFQTGLNLRGFRDRRVWYRAATALPMRQSIVNDNGIMTDQRTASKKKKKRKNKKNSKTSKKKKTSAAACLGLRATARLPLFAGGRIRLESRPNASIQAELSAENITGSGKKNMSQKPWFLVRPIMTKTAKIAGLNMGYDRVITRPHRCPIVVALFWYIAGRTSGSGRERDGTIPRRGS